jgi:hypothetical protein
MSNTQSQDTKQQEASQQPQQQKPTVLEEDDEFEDFPVDGGFSNVASADAFRSLSPASPGLETAAAPCTAQVLHINKLLTIL